MSAPQRSDRPDGYSTNPDNDKPKCGNCQQRVALEESNFCRKCKTMTERKQ